jgi:hypothetical protein
VAYRGASRQECSCEGIAIAPVVGRDQDFITYSTHFGFIDKKVLVPRS